MGDRQTDNPLKIQEISAEEFRACVDQDDFLRRYGNPVVIRSSGQRDVVCMAREYYERLMQERDLFIEDENIITPAIKYCHFRWCPHPVPDTEPAWGDRNMI